MPEVRLIDKQNAQTEIALIAKYIAKSDAQQALIGRILIMLDNMPSIDAEPVRHGRWIKLAESCQADYECSECGAGIGKIKPPYCAICGAKMDLRTPTEVQLDEADNIMMGGADNG